MRKYILFFGSKKGFDRFEYENISGNVRYILCTRLEQARGRGFDGWLLHYTADSHLRKSVMEVAEELNRLSTNVRE